MSFKILIKHKRVVHTTTDNCIKSHLTRSMSWLQKKPQKKARRKLPKNTLADLGRPLRTLCDSVVTDIDELFIKQSWRSNYCGVYSAAMLLSLLGVTTSRFKALALFDLKRSNPDYLGAHHLEIRSVFSREARVSCSSWRYHKRFNFALVSQLLQRHFRNNGCPTLLSFGAIHKNADSKCMHVAVVVAATDHLIELLDPLGTKPQPDARSNVWLQFADPPLPIRVIGYSYSINQRAEVALLHWAAEETI